ncbi:MAG: glycosyltransferase family 39 protein [Candidatus Omnitrophica bacterium]|nr:glycosyltransferase family 39 protein [Candidatus Omnitrophota bacterium]
MDKKVFWRAIGCILGCFVLYVFFSFPSWREPIMGDEVTVANWIKSFGDSTIKNYFIRDGDRLFGMWHPPTYAYLVSLIGKFTVINEASIRMIGVTSFLISLVLIYAIASGLSRKDDKRELIAILSCLIYTLNPLAVKGSILIDLDVILHVAVLALILALVRYRYRENSHKGLLVCIALFTVTLCIKLSTPVILIMSIFVYQFLRREWGKLIYTLKIAAAGIFSALIIWLIYCRAHNIDFFSIFAVPLSVGSYIPLIKSPGKEGWLVLARNIWSPFMWCSPAFIILGVIGFWRNLRTQTENDSLMTPAQFAFYGLLIFTVYMFVGGVSHSFPKYHYAIVPIFSVLAASVVIKNIKPDRQLFLNTAVLISILILYDIYLVKDPIYLISYALKESVISASRGSVFAVAIEWIARMALLLLTIPIAFLFYMNRKTRGALILALFVSMLASNIALLFIQRGAVYNTVYCYGGRGMRGAADIVMSNTAPGDIILAPPEIVLLSGKNIFSYMTAKNLRSKDMFLDMLKQDDVNCVVYGISGNTSEQYKHIFYAKDVKAILNEKYLRHEAGSYTVWVKRKQG